MDQLPCVDVWAITSRPVANSPEPQSAAKYMLLKGLVFRWLYRVWIVQISSDNLLIRTPQNTRLGSLVTEKNQKFMGLLIFLMNLFSGFMAALNELNLK